MNQKSWEINGSVRKILTFNWVDIDVLLVNTIRDTVFIKGDLRFKGRLLHIDDEHAVTERLHKVKEKILEISAIEHIKWELNDWRMEGEKWVRIKNTRG